MTFESPMLALASAQLDEQAYAVTYLGILTFITVLVLVVRNVGGVVSYPLWE